MARNKRNMRIEETRVQSRSSGDEDADANLAKEGQKGEVGGTVGAEA